MQLLNTLYVTTPESYVHLDNQTLRVEVGNVIQHDNAMLAIARALFDLT